MKLLNYCKYSLFSMMMISLVAVASSTEADQAKEQPKSQSTSEEKASEDKQKQPPPEKEEKKQKESSFVFPVYKPPMRGAPAGRLGGGTRGDAQHPRVCVLAPDHVGFTVQEQPCFYWYLSSLTSHPIEFTLIENRAINPVLEKRIPCPAQPGIQKISLENLSEGVSLRKGFRYKWYVSIILDQDHRSKDIISGADIELVSPDESFERKLETADRTLLPHIYAEQGIWYDAVEAVSDLIEKHPGNSDWRKMRASLLEQVGLKGLEDPEGE